MNKSVEEIKDIVQQRLNYAKMVSQKNESQEWYAGQIIILTLVLEDIERIEKENIEYTIDKIESL